MEITWTNDITAMPVELSAAITCNYYWRMPTWYDSNVATDVDIITATGLDSTQAIDMGAGGAYAYDDSYYQTGGTRDAFNFNFFIAHPTTANLFDGFGG